MDFKKVFILTTLSLPIFNKISPRTRAVENKKNSVILGLSKDVTYGNTKLFVQSPESLFQLEEARDKKLPEIVIFLQKIWRGVRARRLYKKMQAAHKIGQWYRKCVRKRYVGKICSTYK